MQKIKIWIKFTIKQRNKKVVQLLNIFGAFWTFKTLELDFWTEIWGKILPNAVKTLATCCKKLKTLSVTLDSMLQFEAHINSVVQS